MSKANKTTEKRRFSRKDTRVEAVLAVGDKTTIQCVILDFCEQGLFLQLHQPSAIGLQKNRSAKLYFSATTDYGKEYFQIDAQIARVADDGIGLVFENISESMYHALMQTTDMGSIAAYSKNPSFFLTSSNQDRFKNAFRDMLQLKIPLLMQEFFKNAEDELEKRPEFVESFKDIAALNALNSVLRINKTALISGFSQELAGKIDFTADKSEQNRGADHLSASLSLVDKQEFEDWLNFSSMIRQINNQYKNQLYQLELKLSYVTCFPRYLINNPIDPEHLCDCFKKKIAGIEESISAKKTLYKAFQATLNAQLTPLYQAFDRLLVEHGAPGDIAHDIVWKKNYPQPSSKRPSNSGNAASSDFNLPAFDNEEYHYADNWTPASSDSRPPARIAQPPISQTASRLFGLINQSLGALPLQPSLQSGPSHEADSESNPGGIQYTPDELLSALTKLQASRIGQLVPASTSSVLAAELQAESGASGYLGNKAISPEDQQKMNVYDQLFQALQNQLMLTPNIKSYLENIKLPLMALTIQDPNFLDSENHPARHLLNQLFSLETAIDHNKSVKNTQIKPLLDKIIARISQGSITNPDIFAKVNEELKEISLPLTKSREQNIRRVIEVYEGKQKLEKARRQIQAEIDNRLAEQMIPSVIQKLLDAGWQHLLVISALNEDESSHYQHYLKVLDELLAWCNDPEPLPEAKQGIIQMELDFIDAKLASVCTNAFTHTSIMEELTATLLGTGVPKVRKPFDRTLITAKAKTAVNQTDTILNSWHLQVDQFNTGDWFTFSLENHDFEPLKLIWIGDTPPVYVFVNRDGYKKQELSRHQLAELLQTGAVTQIENLDEPLMDRATTTMLQQMQEKLIHSVSHDPITSLPNRKRFIHLLKEQLVELPSGKHVLCYLEIEDFRVITNVCGIVGGDQLLLQIAQLVGNALGKNGLISRLGDKTFGFLLKNCTPEEGYDASKKIRDLINKTNFLWNDKSYTIGVSIGLVPIGDNTHNVEELLQKADTVNISAKRAGHNRIRIYQENDEVLKTQTDIHEWAGRIDKIIAENRLFARCQMIAPINPEKNAHSHFEILLGVRDENGNIIVPDKFIPAVERCQRMPDIDRWIVENVFSWILSHKSQFDEIGGFAINLSGQSLNSEEFLSFLKTGLSREGIPADKITFEVTETVAAGSLVFTKRFIKEIKQFGCKFSLDDFGTGYSSYSYLKSLDVDYLKIDGSFVKDIVQNQTDVVMVNSMNEIAHSLQLETIAEYVENMDIHAVLKNIGVDYAQGWGIHKPIPLAELNSFLNETALGAEQSPSTLIEAANSSAATPVSSGDADYDSIFFPFDP